MRNIGKILAISMTSVLLFSGTLGVVSACELEGLSPGFWKNHQDIWVGYSPDQLVGDMFNVPFSDLMDDTLLDALKYGGGSGILGATKNLLRHAVAALLNEAHPGIHYAISNDIICMVNYPLSQPNPDPEILEYYKDILNYHNNLGAEF